MAKEKSGNKAASAAAAGSSADEEFDTSGFTNDTADRSAAWWAVKNGSVLVGDLLGAFDMPDQYNKGNRREYVQVKLLAPTDVSMKDDEGERGIETAEKGTVISVGINQGLRVILEKHIPVVQAGGKVLIKVTVTGPRTLSKTSGNKFWPFKVESKIVRPPTMTVVPYLGPASASKGGNGAAKADSSFENEAGF